MMVAVSISLVFSLFSLSLVPLTSAEKLFCLMLKTFFKSQLSDLILLISLEKRESVSISITLYLGCSTLFCTSLDFQIDFIISLC